MVRLPRFRPRGCVNPSPALVDVLSVLELSELATVVVPFQKAESLSWSPRASFYRKKGLPQWHIGGGKAYSVRAYRMALRDKVH